MLGIIKPREISERTATPELELVFHEIKQVLRVSGVNLLFRRLAACGNFLPDIWRVLRPNLETMQFEAAADQVRTKASLIALQFDALGAGTAIEYGASQEFQIAAALNLYHYINPKLLIVTAAISELLEHRQVGGSMANNPAALKLMQLGVPEQMFPMEMAEEHLTDNHTQRVWSEIVDTLSLRSLNSDYRTLALWPQYLEIAWNRLKPLTSEHRYQNGRAKIREMGRQLARALPLPMKLQPADFSARSIDISRAQRYIDEFEVVLPGLVLNIALLTRDWRPDEVLAASPFPPAVRV